MNPNSVKKSIYSASDIVVFDRSGVQGKYFQMAPTQKQKLISSTQEYITKGDVLCDQVEYNEPIISE